VGVGWFPKPAQCVMMSAMTDIGSSSGETSSKFTKALGTKTVNAAQNGAAIVVGLVGIMWASELVDTIMNNRLDKFGVRPHRLSGLRGIPFAPFLHSGWGHLIGNTVPFAVMGFLVVLGGVSRFIKTFLIIMVASGLGMWALGSSNEVHIGASGIVFGFLGYLVSRGLFEKNIKHILLGVVVAVVYGSLIWGVLPNQRGVSWQGHLFGVIGGIAAAWLLRNDNTKRASATT
jgi:membrane associated rhomboid family serine protease